LGGAVLVPVANAQIKGRRSDLQQQCDVLDGSDACSNAKAGQVDAAQDSVDGIASWKAIRTGAWVGIGVGVAAAATGALLMLSSSSDDTATLSGLSASVDSNSVAVCYGGSF
jgi:hypothetical protein